MQFEKMKEQVGLVMAVVLVDQSLSSEFWDTLSLEETAEIFGYIENRDEHKTLCSTVLKVLLRKSSLWETSLELFLRFGRTEILLKAIDQVSNFQTGIRLTKSYMEKFDDERDQNPEAMGILLGKLLDFDLSFEQLEEAYDTLGLDRSSGGLLGTASKETVLAKMASVAHTVKQYAHILRGTKNIETQLGLKSKLLAAASNFDDWLEVYQLAWSAVPSLREEAAKRIMPELNSFAAWHKFRELSFIHSEPPLYKIARDKEWSYAKTFQDYVLVYRDNYKYRDQARAKIDEILAEN